MPRVIDKCKKFSLYPWIIWVVASLFYGIEYFQRVSPSVMAEPLMQTFHINEATLGFITSFYLYAYALAQIPVGLLLDEYGTRRLLAISCFIISLGSFLFAVSQLLWLLAVARLLIGFGSAFAFIGVLKLAATWFRSSQYPLIVGLTNTLGVAGAILGEAPFANMVDSMGWQHSMIIISVIGFVISIAIYAFIQDYPKGQEATHKPNASWHHVKESLWLILRCRQTWLTAIYAGLMVAPIIAFAELWAVPFLKHAHHISSVKAADLTSAIFVGIGIGGPVNGIIAGRVSNPKYVMFIGNLVAFLGLVVVIYLLHINLYLLMALLFIFGFSTSSMLIAFTINKQRYDLSHSATVIAFTNMMIMMTGAIYQPLIGKLGDYFMASMHGSSTQAFQLALTVLPITSLLSMICVRYIRLPWGHPE